MIAVGASGFNRGDAGATSIESESRMRQLGPYRDDRSPAVTAGSFPEYSHSGRASWTA
jgi:hypothetical protein